MLMDPQKSCLLLVDVQEKLTPLVDQPETLIQNCQWLLQLAHELTIPTLVCEQYPEKLGITVPSLKALTTNITPFAKLNFSCASHPEFLAYLKKLQRSQVVIIGIEAHVCVLQTAMELLQLEHEPFVVADAVSSRAPEDKQAALQRMQRVGIQVVTKEMVFFEWLRQAGTPKFKQLSKQFFS